jgi:hypothetical protein
MEWVMVSTGNALQMENDLMLIVGLLLTLTLLWEVKLGLQIKTMGNK